MQEKNGFCCLSLGRKGRHAPGPTRHRTQRKRMADGGPSVSFFLLAWRHKAASLSFFLNKKKSKKKTGEKHPRLDKQREKTTAHKTGDGRSHSAFCIHDSREKVEGKIHKRG